MGRIAVGKWPTLALAVPGCLMAAGFAAALLMAAVDRHPMWPHQQWNLSEAAAVRDTAEVARLIQFAEDPNVPRDIRAGLLSDHPVRLTPLEAAVAINDGNMVVLLLRSGAVLDAETWNRLQCTADGDEVRRVLENHAPPGALRQCQGVTPPQ